jgi:hypothetical protein
MADLEGQADVSWAPPAPRLDSKPTFFNDRQANGGWPVFDVNPQYIERSPGVDLFVAG